MNAAQPTLPGSLDLDGIVEVLRKAHPDTPFDVIESEVTEAATAYRDATVADFLPVLIERRVKGHLRDRESAAWPLR